MRMFPESQIQVRACEKYKINLAHTTTYKNSTIPYCQRLLNRIEEEKEERRRGGGEGRGGGGGREREEG